MSEAIQERCSRPRYARRKEEYKMNHIAKIQSKLSDSGLDAIIVSSERNQRYTVDFPLMDAYILVAQKHVFLITDRRYEEAAKGALSGLMEILIAAPGEDKAGLLRSAANMCGAVRIGIEEEKLNIGEYEMLQRELDIALIPAQVVFRELRSSKTPEEQHYMRQSQAIAEAALAEVLPLIHPGMTERQVAAELIYRMLRHGSDGGECRPIVVSGERTSLPHGEPTDRVLRAGEFLTMDFGCLKNGYCSDMTRTVAIGHATEEMRHIYSIVLQAQLAGIAAAKAGVTGREIDSAARHVIQEAGYGDFFGHSFGHGIGLEGHEIPGAGSSSLIPLPAGAMISAEPGIYLPNKFGVRIEDVLIITETGCNVITKAPKELLIIG